MSTSLPAFGACVYLACYSSMVPLRSDLLLLLGCTFRKSLAFYHYVFLAAMAIYLKCNRYRESEDVLRTVAVMPELCGRPGMS